MTAQTTPAAPADLLGDINDFHTKFGFTPREIGAKPDLSLLLFRLKFLAEELQELKVASTVDDLENFLDGLVDLVYVALGTAWLFNLDFNKAWTLVHAANMAKVRAERNEDSKRGSTFDVIKPKGWQKPAIATCLDPVDIALKIEKHNDPEQVQGDLFSSYFKKLEAEA